MTDTISTIPKREDRPLPPLMPGDRLTHEEFMERYRRVSEKVKAERIGGIVFMPPPLAANYHGEPHSDWTGWLWVYSAATPGVVVADNTTTHLGSADDAQPDVSLRIDPSHGGRTKLTQDGYIHGAPELIVEVAASSSSYDLGSKLEAYRQAGVNEYIAHRTYDGEIDWFGLVDGRYQKRIADPDGIIRSRVFPGLWLAQHAMLASDRAKVLATLQAGLATPEHATFVLRLAEQAAKIRP